MHISGFLLLPALLGISLVAQAQVYQSTDEEGNVTFSDQETPDSKKILVPEPNVGDSVEVPPPAPEPEPEIVVEETPEAPEGDLYVRDKDSSSSNRRWYHRPRPRPRRGHGR